MSIHSLIRSIPAALHAIDSRLQKSDKPYGDKATHVRFISHLRWVTPLAVAILGVGYVLIEHVVLQGDPLFSGPVIRTVLVIGTVGPILAWFSLSWVVATARAEVEARRELAFRNRELAARNAIGEVANQSLQLEEILQTAMQKMVEIMNLEAAEIRLLDGQNLVLRSHHGLSPEFLSRDKVVPLGSCLCGRCGLQGETLYQSNLQLQIAEPRTRNACAIEGFQSAIAIPMKAKGRLLGVVHAASRDGNSFSQADQQILDAISNRVAVAIENAQLYEEARRRALQLQTASLIGQRMTAVLDLNTLLAEIVKVIRERFGYYHCNLLLVDEATRELVLIEASGAGAELVKSRGLRLKVGEQGITGWVAHTAQAMLCNDVRREPRYYATELVPETKSELAVPLRLGSRVLGVLDVQDDKYDAFDKQDLTVLQILGSQIGIAIENARLFQETARRYDAMVALHEISLDITKQLDTPKLLESLLRRGAVLLNAEASSLFFYDVAHKLVQNVANYNTWRDWKGVTLRLGEGVIGQVILTGKALIVNDYAHWLNKSSAFGPVPQTRTMGAPLRWQDQVIGGIIVANPPQSPPFDGDDLSLLSHFADLAAIAIKNAELHTQVKGFSQAMEQKVEERTQELLRARDEVANKAKQLRSLLGKTIEIQEEERARVARDMHDGVVQLISAARFELQAAQELAGADLTLNVEHKIQTAYQVLGEMEKEIRRAIYDLHPSILDVIGLAPALQKHTQYFQKRWGIACDIKVNGTPYRLPPTTETAIFRMAEEALQNIVSHAHAQAASVVLDYAPDLLCVSVQDNGQGFNYKQWTEDRTNGHLGLLGMQERIELLGGKMDVWSEAGSGTHVTFRLPILPDKDEP